MGEKRDARRNIEQARDSMSDIAEELLRRSSPQYMKAKAKEAAVRKGVEVKERVADSPLAWKIIGGALGAGLAGILARRYQTRELRREEDWVLDDYRWQTGGELVGSTAEGEPIYGTGRYDAGTSSYGVTGYETSAGYESDFSEPDKPGIRDRAADLKGRASEKASDLKGRASEKASDLKGRASEAASTLRERAAELKDRASTKLHDGSGTARERMHGIADSTRERARHLRERAPEYRQRASDTWHRGVDEYPWAILAGAFAAGAAVSLLIPVTEPERRAYGPYREKAMDKLREAKAVASSRIDEAMHQVQEKVGAMGQRTQGEQGDLGLNEEDRRDDQFRADVPVEHKPGEAQRVEPVGSYEPKIH